MSAGFVLAVSVFHLFVNGQEVPVLESAPVDEGYAKAYGREMQGYSPSRYSYAAFEVPQGRKSRVSVRWPGGATNFVASVPFVKSFEPLGRDNALVLVGEESERTKVNRDDPTVRYFGPGRYHEDIVLKSGETLYLARGAWVEGSLRGMGDNIRVCGRGVISGVEGGKKQLARFKGRNIDINGITLFGSKAWTLILDGVENCTVDGIKIVGGVIVCDDGIDMMGVKNVRIRNSFIRNVDDCLAFKYSAENVSVSNCTFWDDMGCVIRIGYECLPPPAAFRDIRIKDCEVLHFARMGRAPTQYWASAMLMIQMAREQVAEDISFENIRYHDAPRPDDNHIILKTMPITEGFDFKEPGHIRCITFRNVAGRCDERPNVYRSEHDSNHRIQQIVME